MIAKIGDSVQNNEPVVPHQKLHTTFTGVMHSISSDEAAVHQYLGIKYATIPARFRQSQLFTSYPPQTDATCHGPICPQPVIKNYEKDLFGLAEEDVPRQTLKQHELECLNLNITCPANATPNSHLPVMLWIHGGGNRGSGSSWLFDGGAFVQKSMLIGKPVILVTINYRLGLLGFTATAALRDDNKAAGDEGVGNYGLRDQRKALEWVYSFISDFGGDSSNITLFGMGSGAADILCHLHSAANDTCPLFQRTIVQSAIMELDVPNVSSAAWSLSRLMSSLQAHSVEELRAVPVEKLISLNSPIRAVDDGFFFAKGWKDALFPEAQTVHESKEHHELVPEIQAFSQRLKSHSRIRSSSRSRSRSRSRARHNHTSSHHHLAPNMQPMMIGDCGAESILWSLPASLWTSSGVVRRIRAVCQSLSKSSALLRAYDISAHTPADELTDRVLELINDARFAWPTECVSVNEKRDRGGHGVWRYVFDQEGPSRGVPHHAVDLVYLFDNVPVSTPTPIPHPTSYGSPDDSPILSPARPDTPELSYSSDTDSDVVDFGFGFTGVVDDEWGTPIVDEWTFTRVRDAVQSRWVAFAYGEAPWSEDKVYVFGPEGEIGERSMGIFSGRRRVGMWKEALEPLGMQLVQKVGMELSNGPPIGRY